MGTTTKATTICSLVVLLAACGGGGQSVDNHTQPSNLASLDSKSDQSPSIEGVQWSVRQIFPGHPYFWLSDLNDAGQLLGRMESTPRGVPSYAISSWVEIIGEGPATGVSGYHQNYPSSFNNLGQIIGTGRTYNFSSSPFSTTETYLASPAGQITLIPDGSSKINNAGQIIGNETIAIQTSDGKYIYGSRAFIYADGKKTDIALLPGMTFNTAAAINDHGHVVGIAYNDDSTKKGFIYSNGIVKELEALAGSARSEPISINNVGQIVGVATNVDGTSKRPFIYTSGVIREIPTPYNSGYAYSINNHGQVIGVSVHPTDPVNHPSRAFIYSGGKTLDLNTLPEVASAGLQIHSANKINNNGQILASGTRRGATIYEAGTYVLLTPLKPASGATW